MTEYKAMSLETFNENNADILAGINLLMTNPKSRKTFRLFELNEMATGELLAEVFQTTHGSVVVHRSSGRVSRRGKSDLFVRQGRDSDDLIVAPLTGDPDQRFRVVAASTADRSFSGAMIRTCGWPSAW
jgi:hypothetical protein